MFSRRRSVLCAHGRPDCHTLEIKAIFGGGPDNVRIEASQEWNCRHKENSSIKPRTLSKSRKRSRDWTMRRYPCSVFNQPKKVTNDSCAREFECYALRRITRRAALLPLWGSGSLIRALQHHVANSSISNHFPRAPPDVVSP